MRDFVKEEDARALTQSMVDGARAAENLSGLPTPDEFAESMIAGARAYFTERNGRAPTMTEIREKLAPMPDYFDAVTKAIRRRLATPEEPPS